MAVLILAHDLGTSGNKASLFSEDGRLVASTTIPYETHYPKRGWAEQDPNVWWEAVCTASKKVMVGQAAADVKAIALSGHMMGCLPLDREGNPLAPSMIWSDGRAEEESAELIAKLGEVAYNRITGQPVSPYYPLPKIMWLRRHKPDIYQNTAFFVQAKDYINFRLTGVIATDITDAAYSLAYDINSHCWSQEILNAAGVPVELFPKVVPSDTIVGTVTKQAAEACGLREGIPVAAGAGDGSAAHIGAASVEDGDIYICLGSSTWLISTTSQLYFDDVGRMQSEPHVLRDRYVFGGTMQTGGLSYAWAQENMSYNAVPNFREVDAAVEKTKPGAGGVVFHPYLLGERSPWYDPKACANFLGLRQECGYGDMSRAVLEGVAHNLKILLDVVHQHTQTNDVVLIGGGAKSSIWRQIMADILEKPMLLPENLDQGTSVGSAIIAGVGAGIFKDYSVTKTLIPMRAKTEPRPELYPMYREKQAIFEDAFHALKNLNHRIFDSMASQE